jgi:hypothetical protein
MRAVKLAVLASVFVAAIFGTSALAQQMDAQARADAVAKLSTALRDRYVFPDVGAKAAETISANLKSGAYDQLSEPGAFAQRLTDDLSAVAHDKHMRVTSRSAPPPKTGDAPKPPPTNESGVVRADKLPGEIGYIEVIGFPPPQWFKPVIDRAMTALAGSKALIFDLRRNGGGSPGSVAYLVSFLAPEGAPTHINDIVSRKAGTLEFSRQTFNSQATPVRFARVPVFVLTSGKTFSGGEEFAYDLQALKLATLVGETTGGGANPVSGARLTDDLSAMVPFGRAENPVTKTNWEGVGVKPEIAVPADEALAAALKRLGRPSAATVAEANGSQVFAPRSIPTPGAREVLERVIKTARTDDPDTGFVSASGAKAFPQQVALIKSKLETAGTVRNVAFHGPNLFNGDTYDVTFEHGVLRFDVVLDAQGKLEGVNVASLPPAPQPGR